MVTTSLTCKESHSHYVTYTVSSSKFLTDSADWLIKHFHDARVRNADEK